jgi:hypothetical protein
LGYRQGALCKPTKTIYRRDTYKHVILHEHFLFDHLPSDHGTAKITIHLLNLITGFRFRKKKESSSLCLGERLLIYNVIK